MEFNEGAQLDTSQIDDRRGSGGGAFGGGIPMGRMAGGGGVIGIIITVIFLLISRGGGGGGVQLPGMQMGGQQVGDNTNLSASCRTGGDANQKEDCRMVGVVNSVQKYWSSALPGYRSVKTVFFSNQTNTGCGGATSATGPFYCPNDTTVYLDLTFFDELRSRFGAKGGPFAQAYVVAHEYGHHVQNLTGVLGRAQDGSTGPTSSSVRIELQADCYAGVWTNHAEQTGYIKDLTQADIDDGLNAAAAVGDDHIQETMQGRVTPEKFTHGTSSQRQRWFSEGYRSGDPKVCDTFQATSL
jgi:predicted metalloprotease